MSSIFCGFVPFRTEADWLYNAIEQVSRPAVSDGVTWHDCVGCEGVFTEDELCEITGFCAACNAKLDAAIVVYEDEGE